MKTAVKSVVIMAVLLAFSSFVFGQACGGSVRTLKLKYAPGVKKPLAVSYQLFYLLPPNKKFADMTDEEITERVSEFFYRDPKKGTIRFWFGFDERAPLLAVPFDRAEAYIKNYKFEDFKEIYGSGNFWLEHHLPQLKGKFKNDTIKLKTGETDSTPFLMKIEAKGFDPVYLLSAFLGGCHYRPRDGSMVVQTIDMTATQNKKIKKSK